MSLDQADKKTDTYLHKIADSPFSPVYVGVYTLAVLFVGWILG